MTNQQIEELNELVRSWRRRDYGTGFADYDNGVDSGRESCADALDELLAHWHTRETSERNERSEFA